MIQKIQKGFFPELKPELRHFRALLLRNILLAITGFLAAWYFLFLLVALFQSLPINQIIPISLVFFGYTVVALFLLMRVRRDHVLSSAYLLIATLMLLAVSISVSFPEGVFFANAAFLISIIIAAAVISRSATYFIAASSIVLVAVESVIVSNRGFDPIPFAPQIPALYSTIGFAFIAIALAMILTSLAKRVETTIGNLQLQAEKLAHLAHTDPLTGLANRRYLFDQLKTEFARSRRYERTFSLLFIDLDNFKLINDRFGHMIGDEALQGAADSLNTPLRTADMLARIGGDEFAVLLPETDLKGGIDVVARLQETLKAFGREFKPEPLEMTFSAGLSQLQDEDISIDQILTRADDAQYLAKREGTGELRTDLDLEKTAELEALELRNQEAE